MKKEEVEEEVVEYQSHCIFCGHLTASTIEVICEFCNANVASEAWINQETE